MRTYVRRIFARRSASMPYCTSSELNAKYASARVTPANRSYLKSYTFYKVVNQSVIIIIIAATRTITTKTDEIEIFLLNKKKYEIEIQYQFAKCWQNMLAKKKIELRAKLISVPLNLKQIMHVGNKQCTK